MRTQPRADTQISVAGTLRFRAPTLDEAIERAEQSLGGRVRIVAANHIRRGGIGGFFASDLGVEIEVELEDETVEEALGRLVDESAAEERRTFTNRFERAAATAADEATAPVAATTSRASPRY